MIFKTAKVMSNGQITLPIDIRKSMGLSTGDRVALIFENNRVIMMNPAIYAMETPDSLRQVLIDAQEHAKANGTSALTMDEIDEIIAEVRGEARGDRQ